MNEKIFRDRWWSISILRRNKRNKDKETPRAGWKNVNQEDNNNNKIRRRRVSREIILQILFPRSLENLAGSYTEYGINGIQGTCRILDPTQTSERKFRPRFLVEFSPSLSLSRPRAEKDNRGCSLSGKKAGKQRHKVAVVHLHMVYRSVGVKDETIHGGRIVNRRDFSSRVSNSNRETGFVPFEPIFTDTGNSVEIVELRAIVFFFFFCFFWRIGSIVWSVRGFNLGWMMEEVKVFLRMGWKGKLSSWEVNLWYNVNPILMIQFLITNSEIREEEILIQLSLERNDESPRTRGSISFIFKLIPLLNEGKRERKERRRANSGGKKSPIPLT